MNITEILKGSKADKGGKRVPEWTEKELAIISKLAQSAVDGDTSIRRIIMYIKDQMNEGQHVRGLNKERTHNNIKTKLIEIYQKLKGEIE